MDNLISIFIIGLSVGSMYALLALGLAMVFSILHLLNMAHGELIAVTGYSMYFLTMTGLPFPLIVIFAILFACLAALLMERIAFRPIRGAFLTTGLITSFGLEMILQAGWQNFISPLRIPVKIPLWLIRFWEIGDAGVSTYQGVAIVLTILAVGSLTVFLKRTTMGLAMRAAAENFRVTQLMGIRANRVIAVAFAISGLLAGLSAFLYIAQRGSCEPHSGLDPLMMAFVALVFGGVASLSGAVAGGLFLGMMEVALRTYLPESALPFEGPIKYFVVILILLRWPDGLISVFNKAESH